MEPGLQGEKTIVVTEDMLASHVGSGLVDVFATPMMIAGFENLCSETVQREIGEENVTVGTYLDVSHDAATPLGMQVTFRCQLTAVEGRKLTFQVEAFDEVDKIGGGSHQRFIVNREKFAAKAQSKNQK